MVNHGMIHLKIKNRQAIKTPISQISILTKHKAEMFLL